VVLALVLLTAVFAGAAQAGDLATSEDVVVGPSSTDATTDTSGSADPVVDPTDGTTDTSGSADPVVDPTDATTDTSGSSDPVVDPTQPEPPSDGSSAPGAPSDSTSETPTDPVPPPEPPVDSTGDTESSSPPESTPPPEQTEAPGNMPQAPAQPGLTVPVIIGTNLTSSAGLDFLGIRSGASTKDRDAHFSDRNAPSQESSAMRPFPQERLPASSSSSGSSGGSGAGGSGGGVGLAVEFFLAVLFITRCVHGVSFTLPHSCAFALREERPG
jgi:hypothetical protein